MYRRRIQCKFVIVANANDKNTSSSFSELNSTICFIGRLIECLRTNGHFENFLLFFFVLFSDELESDTEFRHSIGISVNTQNSVGRRCSANSDSFLFFVAIIYSNSIDCMRLSLFCLANSTVSPSSAAYAPRSPYTAESLCSFVVHPKTDSTNDAAIAANVCRV